MIPIAVTIAGSDSGGGAGIQADLKTFSALGVYGATVIAALTAQNTKGVTGIHDVPPEFVTAQFDAVYSDHDAAYADDEPDSHALLEAEETREALIAAIADLPERLQLVVQLYFVEELNLSEIAEVLEVSVPRVHQLKAQAMGKLRTSLEHIADVL